MHCAYAGTSQYGNGQLGYHAHVYAYTVALGNAIVLEHTGKLTHLVVQIAVGDDPMVFFGVVGFPDDGRFVAQPAQVPVQAILGNIQFGTLEPFYIGCVEIPFQQCVPTFPPEKRRGNCAPVTFRVCDTFIVGRFIFFVRLYLIRI